MSTATSTGPVEYVVVKFPGNHFKGEITPALGELVENGTIRIIDLVFITKDDEGNVAALELEDLPGEHAASLTAVAVPSGMLND
jgi:hypothetical protein